MAFLEGLQTKASTSGELFRFFLQNKWWWLAPMLSLLLLFAILIVVAESSAIAPFIYTLF